MRGNEPCFRTARGLAACGLLLLLSGCATQRSAATAGAGAPPPQIQDGRDATGAYRFNMTQDGRRMSADEFDAWMKARGIRVAKGPSPAHPPARVAARAPGRKATAKRQVAATPPAAAAKSATATTRPATVAQAGKPKAKARETAAAKQGAGEG